MALQIMKKFSTSSVLLCSAAVQASQNHDSKPEPALVRRTDLPIYAEDVKTETKKEEEYNPAMMEAITSFRVEACKIVQNVKSVTDRCSRFVDTGVAHSKSSYVNATEFLREDGNLLPRMGAIASGVVVGYVISLRRGYFKRLLYSSIGGMSVAAICYPKEADEYFESSMQLSRRYGIIGYHFFNGVTKDFLGFELPPLPQKVPEPVDKKDEKPNQ